MQCIPIYIQQDATLHSLLYLALCVLDWHCTGTVRIGITCSVLTVFVMD